MKQGIGFIRSQSAMEALMVLAFCMTLLGVPMLTFLPVFAKDIFHQGPGDVHACSCRSRASAPSWAR